jgi:hypothetical protein
MYRKLYQCSFYNIFRQFCFDQAFMSKTPCDCMCFGRFPKISLCITQEKAAPPALTPHPPTATSYCSAGFDWLSVDLEVRCLCYWPTPQTGIQTIEECKHITHGRRPIGPHDVIRIVLISSKVVFLGVANQPPCHALEGALNAICKMVKVMSVRDTHSGGWSRNINARYLHTLMVYL